MFKICKKLKEDFIKNEFNGPDDFPKIDQSYASILFKEIDQSKDKLLQLSEVFRWLVNQMKGLPMCYRTQINK